MKKELLVGGLYRLSPATAIARYAYNREQSFYDGTLVFLGLTPFKESYKFYNSRTKKFFSIPPKNWCFEDCSII